jgi:hypothetical protein
MVPKSRLMTQLRLGSFLIENVYFNDAEREGRFLLTQISQDPSASVIPYKSWQDARTIKRFVNSYRNSVEHVINFLQQVSSALCSYQQAQIEMNQHKELDFA